MEAEMNDAISGSIVAAITAAAVAGIFYWNARAKRKRIGMLRTLCGQHGWSYTYEVGPLHQKHTIGGDGWVCEAQSRSSGRESAPGSSSWLHGTRWRSLQENPGRQNFYLGTRRSGGMDLAQAPSWALSRLFGEEVSGLKVADAGARLSARYVLFGDGEKKDGNLVSSKSEELLLAWPEKLPLLIRSSPAELSLQVQDKRLDRAEEILPFLELAESFFKF
jgi:hypothetical protein